MILKTTLTTAIGVCIIFTTRGQADSSQAYFNKGLEEKNAKHWLVASKYFDKSISFNDKNAAAYVESGLVNVEMRRTDAALSNFSKAYEIDPNNATALKQLMDITFNYHQWAKVIDYAAKCAACDEEEKNKKIAISYYHLEDYPKAERALLSAIKLSPENAELNYTLAKTYMEMEADQKAYPYFKKAIELDTNKVSWMIEFADENYSAQHFRDAVVYYNKALAHGYVANSDFNTDLGFSYMYSNEYQKGEELIKKQIEKNPGKKELYSDMSDAFYNRKMYDKALEYSQQLIALDPKDAKALYQAGIIYQKKGEKEKGQAMCDKAIQMDPSLNSLKKKLDSTF